MLKRIFIALVILFTATSVYLFNSLYNEAKNSAITKLNEEQMIHARQAAQGIEDSFATWTRNLNSLAKMDAVIDTDAVGKRYLQLFYEANQEQILSITRLDTNGKILYNLPSSNPVGTDISDQKHVRELLQKHQPVLSDVFKAVEGFYSVALHVPVFRGAEFQGSIGILINFEILAKRYLDVIRIGETGYAWVVSRAGTILYTPVPGFTGRDVSEAVKESPTLMSMVSEMLKGHEGVATYSFDWIGARNVGQTTKYAVYMPVQLGDTFWSISVASAEQDVLSGLVSFRNKLALVIGALFIGGMLFSILSAKAWFIVKEEEKSRQLDTQLRDSKLSLGMAVESAGLGLWSIDKETGLIWTSDRTLEMYGFKATETVTIESFLSIVHEEDRERVVQVIEEVFRNQGPGSVEYRISLPDGSLRWMAARGCGTFSSSGSVAMTGLSNDITERKLVEHELANHRDYLEELVKDRTEKLRQALETAETANRAKSMFLANMSHELRTPLNAVLGFAQLLESDPSLSPQGRNRAKTIMKSGEYLLSIINDVLAMSRIEAGRIELRTAVVDLGDLLHDLAAMFRLQTEAKGISFSIDCAEDLPRFIMADIGKLNQVLINLLGNAVKFTQKGSISLRAYPAGVDRIAVEIEDTGIGISMEEREALFDPFVRSKNGEQYAGGTGLGLAISRQYAQLMGGEITVASTLDCGSCFRFEFHAPPACIQPIHNTGGQRVVGLAPGQGDIHVLVVDDQEINRNLLRAMLEPLGFIVEEASGGSEALEIARFRSPRIILMDLVMPGMDGAETARSLRTIPSVDSATIIGISASTFVSEKEDFLDAGINAFIAKPFRKQELYDELARHAGVAFVTEAAVSVMTGGASVPSLERMSPAWLKRFSQALSRGDTPRIRHLGDEALESDPLLSVFLLERAALYDLDGLKKLIPVQKAP